MKSTNWKGVAEFVGISAIIASLIFVGVQIQQDRQVAIAQINMAALEASVAVQAAITENAVVWSKARNMEVLSISEFQIIESLVDMASDRAFFQALSYQNISEGSGPVIFRETSGPIRAFSTLLYENPGAREIWAEWAGRQDAYVETFEANRNGVQFNDVVRRHLAKLEERHGH